MSYEVNNFKCEGCEHLRIDCLQKNGCCVYFCVKGYSFKRFCDIKCQDYKTGHGLIYLWDSRFRKTKKRILCYYYGCSGKIFKKDNLHGITIR